MSEQKIRATAKKMWAEHGHGGRKALAEAAGVSSETIRRFCDGARVSGTTLKKISAALESLDYAIESGAVETDADEFTVLADRLHVLARRLTDARFSRAHRADEFARFVRGSSAYIDEYIRILVND